MILVVARIVAPVLPRRHQERLAGWLAVRALRSAAREMRQAQREARRL
jgi:hypothetical protein